MPDAPQWSVDDVVYLRESAAIGFLESYKITNIVWDTSYSRWLYEVDIRHRGTEPNTVIDAHNLRRVEVLTLGENDLISLGDALDLAIINTEQRLKYLRTQKEHYDATQS